MSTHRRRGAPSLAPLPCLADPPQARLAKGAVASVMRSEWTDPDDIKPNARHTARRIVGYRSFCPLRRAMRHDGSGITELHIAAADKLREIWDVARLGYSANAHPLVHVVTAQRPRSGPSQAEQARERADRTLRRALALFTAAQRELLDAVVLRNITVHAFASTVANETGQRFDPNTMRGKLIAVLDVLATHWQSELEEELARGKRLLV